MRPEYDFSKAVRGVTATRYAEGTNVVLLDPDVAGIFPDTRAVNEALRTIARLTRTTLRQRPHLGWKFALNVELGEKGFDPIRLGGLVRFRERLVEHESGG